MSINSVPHNIRFPNNIIHIQNTYFLLPQTIPIIRLPIIIMIANMKLAINHKFSGLPKPSLENASSPINDNKNIVIIE